MNVIEFRGAGSTLPAYKPPPPKWWRRRWFKVVLWLTIVCCFVFVVSAEYIIRNAEPFLRKRVIQTLSAEFTAPVELDELHISLAKGVEVQGKGLRIAHFNGAQTDNEPGPAPQAMLSVQTFSFHTALRKLFHSPTRIGTVTLTGMELHVPPPGQRSKLLSPKQNEPTPDLEDTYTRPNISLIVDQFKCSDAKLFIGSSEPGKDPLELDIQDLHLQNLGAHRPFTYQAELINPKPVGNIHASGHLGSWDADNPAATPLDGNYEISHSDPSRDGGSMRSSTRHFNGVLNQLARDVDGLEIKDLARTDAPVPQISNAKNGLLQPVDHVRENGRATSRLLAPAANMRGDMPTGFHSPGAANGIPRVTTTDPKTTKQTAPPTVLGVIKAQPESEKTKKQQEKAAHAASDLREKAQRKAQKEEEKAERRAAAEASRHSQ